MQGTPAMNAPQAVETAPAQSAADARLQRNLKIVVIALAVLLVAGLATVIGRIIYLASGKPAQRAASGLALAPETSLQLPAGAQVRSISLSGDRLAVHYEAAGAEGIAVLDLLSGRPITAVGIRRALPE
jgi:hypothetical protein